MPFLTYTYVHTRVHNLFLQGARCHFSYSLFAIRKKEAKNHYSCIQAVVAILFIECCAVFCFAPTLKVLICIQGSSSPIYHLKLTICLQVFSIPRVSSRRTEREREGEGRGRFVPECDFDISFQADRRMALVVLVLHHRIKRWPYRAVPPYLDRVCVQQAVLHAGMHARTGWHDCCMSFRRGWRRWRSPGCFT